MLGANGHRGLGLIYAGRVLAGFGVGGASMVVPIYISELAPPAVRGRLVGIYELGWQIGYGLRHSFSVKVLILTFSSGLVGFWINYGINETLAPSHTQWLIPFAVQLIPAGMLLIGSLFVKESPRWLIANNRREQGIKNLCWIRNLPADELYIVEEVAFIDAALEEQATKIGVGFWKPFQAVAKNKKIQWRFFLGGILFMWQNGSGMCSSLIMSKAIADDYSSDFRYQCDQLLLSNRLSIDRHRWHQHKLPFDRFVWCRQDLSHVDLAILPYRPTRTTKASHVWRLWWIDLHVDYRMRSQVLLLLPCTNGAQGGYLSTITVVSSKDAVAKPLSSGGTAALFFFYLWTAFYVRTTSLLQQAGTIAN